MTKLSEVKVYKGKNGDIVFELEKIQNGFAVSRPRQNSVFLKTGTFETWTFAVSLIRNATEQEAKDYDALKEEYIKKEYAKAVPMSEFVRGEIFRLPLQTDRYRVIKHEEHKGEPSTRVIKLNGRNQEGLFNAATKAIKL